MSRFIQSLYKGFALLVSLPRNDPALAREAREAGADALKIHLNLHHRASGTTFGPWEKEREAFLEIVRGIDIPAGIVPGAEKMALPEEMAEMAQAGVDFWDLYLDHVPTWLLPMGGISLRGSVVVTPWEGMGRVGCIDGTWRPEDLAALSGWGLQALECSPIPGEGYGRPLSLADLARYRRLIENVSMPVFISTQRKIEPAQLEHLVRAGARGIAIGAVVFGQDGRDLGRVTGEFRKAIDSLKEAGLAPTPFGPPGRGKS